MNTISYQQAKTISKEDFSSLYNDAGWKAYTSNMENLENAIKNSLYVLTTRDGDQLIGLYLPVFGL